MILFFFLSAGFAVWAFLSNLYLAIMSVDIDT
jgi:hypothetical protein